MAADPNDFSERYELVERIAVGGMAEVFRAKKYGSHGFAKQMAVKRILPSLAADEEFVTRFIAEAKIAVTLSHANIVQVFDFSRFGDSLYIAMEFVDGADLADVLVRCRRNGETIGVAPSMHIAMELLKGIDFAHRSDVVHRDISPSNILVSRAGEVKIADFGIAQAAGLKLTRQHRVMGKWPYMSPEQTQGADLDVRSDLFSAGAVLYETLTGERLFRGKNAEEIVRAIAERPVPAPSSIRADLPLGIDAPLLSLLQRDPSKRPSAADVLSQLVEVSYQSTVQATSASLAGEMERLIPKKNRDDTGSTKLLDDIINSELAHVRGPGTRNTRVTIDAPSKDRAASEGLEPTQMTFIKTSVGDTGLSEWVVGDSTGTFSLKRTDQLYALDGGEANAAAPVQEANKELGKNIDTDVDADDDYRAERTIIDATSGAGRAMVVDPRPQQSARSKRRLWPVVVSGALFAAIVAIVVLAGRGSDSAEPRSALVADASSPLIDAAPVAEPPPAMLRLTSTPSGANVTRDGQLIGTTPTEIVHPGAGVLEFQLSDHEPCLLDLNATATSIACELDPAKARLIVTSKPKGAAVFLDGKKLGSTPIDVELEPRPGSIDVLIRKRGFVSATQRVNLAAGSEAKVQKQLEAEAKKGRIDLFSEPWANVYFRGKKIGVAPARGLVLPAGKHRLTLVNPVQKRRTTITVTIPGPKRYKVVLPK